MRGESLQAPRGPARSVRGGPTAPIPDFVRVSGALVEAELRLVLGEPERAWSVLAELETDGDAPDVAIGIAALELAHRAPRGRHRERDRLFGQRPPALCFRSPRSRRGLVEAVARDCAATITRAPCKALERALDLAEPRGYADGILHFGAPLKSLLRRRIRQGTGHRVFAGELLTALEEGTAAMTGEPEARLLLEPLSERELAVLRFLPTMMSNAEIAGEMFVSVNTVKTHLKHVYRKLDVADRREAVRRGREPHLLSVGLGDR